MYQFAGTLFSLLGSKPLYLDPGSGSFLLQLLIAGLLGLGIALRSQWGRIKGLFGGKSKPTDEEDEDSTDEQPK
jgi:hypothetical protein